MQTLKLNDGVAIPMFGLGMWIPNSEEIPQSKDMVVTAIKHGYRLFDTAALYEDEAELGEALKISGLQRNEYFVVTKLHPEKHGYHEAKRELNESLKKLRLDFVDLYLIHTPKQGRLVETWKALIEMKEEGKIRSIGVSNFNVHHLEGIASAGLPVPSVNQLELHPWHQQSQVVDYCHNKGIGLMAFCPVVRGKKFNFDPVLAELSKNYGKTEAQILIRWSIQRDFVCIPKSSNERRIKENMDVFDFNMSNEDMEKLNKLDCKYRISIDHIDSPWIG